MHCGHFTYKSLALVRLKPGSQYDDDAQLSVKLQRNRLWAASFDVDADVYAGIGFISIVDVGRQYCEPGLIYGKTS